MKQTLARRVVAEALGTAILLSAIVGSGIMAERLAGGNVAVALLANTIATGAVLVALILTFGTISGAHFNPAVTICDAWQKGISRRDAFAYIVAQIGGAFAGVAAANLMFELPVFFASQKVRSGTAQWFSEFVAAFGLMAVIWGCSRLRSAVVVPVAVAAYIMAAYWFTASTSFANPAVTLARSMSDTFSRYSPVRYTGFRHRAISRRNRGNCAVSLACAADPKGMRRRSLFRISRRTISPTIEAKRSIKL